MTDALFVVRRMQEEYRDKKKKLCMRFVDIEKTIDNDLVLMSESREFERKVFKMERGV